MFSKPLGDMTVEELERVAEVAKRWWFEDGREEAYKLFLIATAIRAYKLYVEKRGGEVRTTNTQRPS